MWGEIALSLGTSILEASYTRFINSKARKSMHEKLNKITESLFAEFCDSSIDTDEFYSFINNYKFKELLENYFYTLRDGMGVNEYKENLITYTHTQCPKANRIDLLHFFNKLEELYIEFLNKIIEKNPELNALFHLLTVSHRSIISKFSERVEDIERYFDSTQNAIASIDDKRIDEYHRICEKEYGFVRFTGISGAERKEGQEINKLYISNTFSFFNIVSAGGYNEVSFQNNSIKLKELFDFGNKIVIIGGAGYGKTTTLNYLFCNYEKIFKTYPLKIKIDLKEYAEDIYSNKCDILSCIAKQFCKKSKRTNLSADVIEKLLGDFLDGGKCLVIFDALDEIATPSARGYIRTEISNFCELYYLNKFIISTREVGYLNNKFDNSFIHVRINKFDDKQIKAYSRNWYKYYYETYSKSDFETFWLEFLKEADKARCTDLIKNPIILILALIVFDADGKLPNKRIEFYRKCIDTFLFQREDRKAIVELSKSAKNILKMDMTLPRVAHYKYQRTNENISYKFTNDELKNSVFKAIEVSDVINWTSAVDEYIGYLLERTELVEEIDEDIYDFAHKTFYEYFLALYFSMQLDNNILQRQLLKWIGDANNHELAQIIIEKIIESGDRFKQTETLNFLFKVASDGRQEKRKHVLELLNELYSCNILPLKYYDDYYKTILLSGEILYNMMHNIRTARRASVIKYDEQDLATIYCQYVNDIDRFINTAESLIFLNDDFKEKALSSFYDTTLLENTLILFSWLRCCNVSQKVADNDKVTNTVEYFANHESELLKNCPIIWVSLVEVVFSSNMQDKFSLEKLVLKNMQKNSYYYRYSTPRILTNILNSAVKNDTIFTILLQLMIVCSNRGTNTIIGFLLDEFDETSTEALDFTFWLWEALNLSKEYTDFEKKIKERDLFNPIYADIYTQTYALYVSDEKSHTDNRITYFLEKKNKGD